VKPGEIIPELRKLVADLKSARSVSWRSVFALSATALLFAAAVLAWNFMSSAVSESGKNWVSEADAQSSNETVRSREQRLRVARDSRELELLRRQLQQLVDLESTQRTLASVIRESGKGPYYWPPVQVRIKSLRDAVQELYTSLTVQDQRGFVVEQFPQYRQLVIDLGRRLEIYDELERTAAGGSHPTQARASELGKEYAELNARIFRHQAALYQVVSPGKQVDASN
jgi:hypothetical protein